jgi:hypothetical protein
MPDSPDFDQIARDAIDRWGGDEAPIQRALIVEDIAEQLRQVWNARGAADLATKRRWSPRQLAEIRALDR